MIINFIQIMSFAVYFLTYFQHRFPLNKKEVTVIILLLHVRYVSATDVDVEDLLNSEDPEKVRS